MEAHALVKKLSGERVRFVRLVRMRVQTDADADDIVQNALLRASQRSGSLQSSAQALAWFYRILRNAVADHHRARRADPMRSPSAVELEDIPGAEATEHAACTCGLRLLEQLRPAYADVLRRVDRDGEDPGVVAAALGVSLSNLYVRLHRARRALHEDVRHYCGVTSIAPCLDCGCAGHHRCGGG
jgi:RNA polymerase sigma-70 factor (ECF subfamily)